MSRSTLYVCRIICYKDRHGNTSLQRDQCSESTSVPKFAFILLLQAKAEQSQQGKQMQITEHDVHGIRRAIP